MSDSEKVKVRISYQLRGTAVAEIPRDLYERWLDEDDVDEEILDLAHNQLLDAVDEEEIEDIDLVSDEGSEDDDEGDDEDDDEGDEGDDDA